MKNLTIRFPRGDSGAIVPLPLKLPGDHTQRKLRFRVLIGKEETSKVMFSRSSTNNSGEAGELLIEYDSVNDVTNVTPMAVPENTLGNEADTYYFSMTSTSADDETDVQTTHKGEFILEWDGESPFNEVPLPEDYEKIIVVDTTEFNESSLIMFKVGEGFVPITLLALEELLNKQNNLLLEGEFDPFNPEAISPNVDGLTKRVEDVNDSILLELDENQNVTIKE